MPLGYKWVIKDRGFTVNYAMPYLIACPTFATRPPARVCVAANMFDLAYWHLALAFSVTLDR